MKLYRSTILLVSSLFTLNAAANTANQFDYFGISFQNNSYDDLNFSPQIKTSELTPLLYDSSASASGWRGFVGHQFNRYIAFEAGITSFGAAKFNVKQKEIDSDGKITYSTVYSGKFKTLAGDLRAVATYPLNNRLFLKAHIGAYLWDNEFSTLIGEVDAPQIEKLNDTGVSLLTGIGVGYGFNSQFAVSLDFENTEIANITTNSLSLSLLARF